jgi:nucleoid DNA-binding protein
MTKNKMVREIGKRTRLKNRIVQAILESLVEVWVEELVSGGRIELENFLVLETKRIDRSENPGCVFIQGEPEKAPRFIYKLMMRPSKRFRKLINGHKL